MKLKNQANEKLDMAYKQYYDVLSRFCNVRLKNQHQAEDCVQEAFLILYKKYLQREEIENVRLFLYKIADNLVKAQWRKNQKEEHILDIETLSEALAVKEDFFEQLDFDELTEKLSAVLNENELLVYKLKYIEDKTIKEISDETGLSFEAVAKRLSRLRIKLRELFQEQQ